jgi:hypothetical protein
MPQHRHAGLDPASTCLSPPQEEGGPRIKSGVTAEFASAAAQLAGLAGALLGWRPGEFWMATPAELAAVLSALTPRSEAPAGADVLAELQARFPDG